MGIATVRYETDHGDQAERYSTMVQIRGIAIYTYLVASSTASLSEMSTRLFQMTSLTILTVGVVSLRSMKLLMFRTTTSTPHPIIYHTPHHHELR